MNYRAPSFRFWCFLGFLLCLPPLFAIDYEDGRIRLKLDQSTGRFSLYYMTDVDKKIYEPLFWDRDRKTSFFSVSLDGTEFRLGETHRFKTYLRGTERKPALVFESPMLAVTVEFSFIRTASSGVSNGVRADIKIENWSEKVVNAGARLLVDSFLGESGNPNFRTDLRPIESETLVDQSSRDQWWLSRNDKYGLMGSIFVEGLDPPSAVHFANWKRLYRANFKPEYVPTRNFNELPFSVRDSAVSYYLDVLPLERWQSRSFSVLLAADDKYGFDIKKSDMGVIEHVIVEQTIIEEPRKENGEKKIEVRLPERNGGPMPVINNNLMSSTPALPFYDRGESAAPQTSAPQQQTAPPAAAMPAPSYPPQQSQPPRNRGTLMLPIGPIRLDLMTLRELINKVDEYIYWGTPLSEEELRAMEMTIGRLRSRYGGMMGGAYW